MGSAAAAVTAAASAAAAAFTAVGAANASYAPFLCSVNIVSRQGDNGQDHQSYQNVIHNYFLPERACRSAWPLLALRIRLAMMATITPTATRPGRKPAPSLPVVTRVPT